MVLSVLDSLGNKTCGIILDMFQCFFSFPLVSLHLHSSINYTNLSVRVCQVAQSCLTLCNPMDCSPPGSSAHGDSPGKNTGVGCHVLLQGIFPTHGLNPGLPHCRQILYRMSHQGRPRILEWVAISLLQGIFPGMEQGSPALQADSLPAELPGKVAELLSPLTCGNSNIP